VLVGVIVLVGVTELVGVTVFVGVTLFVGVCVGVGVGVLDGQGTAVLQSLHAPTPLYIVLTDIEGVSVVAVKVTTK